MGTVTWLAREPGEPLQMVFWQEPGNEPLVPPPAPSRHTLLAFLRCYTGRGRGKLIMLRGGR